VIGWKFTPDEAIRPVLFGVKTQSSWKKRIDGKPDAAQVQPKPEQVYDFSILDELSKG